MISMKPERFRARRNLEGVMPSHLFAGRLLGRRSYAAVAVLAIVLVGFATFIVASHNDVSDRDCPFCQIAHLPVLKPAGVAQPAPPRAVEHYVAAQAPLQELE